MAQCLLLWRSLDGILVGGRTRNARYIFEKAILGPRGEGKLPKKREEKPQVTNAVKLTK